MGAPSNHGAWLSLARALRSGRRGRKFKSCRPDCYPVRTYVKLKNPNRPSYPKKYPKL